MTGLQRENHESLWERYNKFGKKALDGADYDRAKLMFELALIEAKKSSGDEPRNGSDLSLKIAAATNNLAEAHRLSG